MTTSATDQTFLGRTCRAGEGFTFRCRGQSVPVALVHVNTFLRQVTVTVARNPVTLGEGRARQFDTGGRGCSVKLSWVEGSRAHMVFAAHPDVTIDRPPAPHAARPVPAGETESDRRPITVRRDRA